MMSCKQNHGTYIRKDNVPTIKPIVLLKHALKPILDTK
jgi:hypothetical protein